MSIRGLQTVVEDTIAMLRMCVGVCRSSYNPGACGNMCTVCTQGNHRYAYQHLLTLMFLYANRWCSKVQRLVIMDANDSISCTHMMCRSREVVLPYNLSSRYKILPQPFSTSFPGPNHHSGIIFIGLGLGMRSAGIQSSC